MANGWTPERRARQAVRIRNWKPWEERSTGPKSAAGEAASAQNPYRGATRRWLRELRRGAKRPGRGSEAGRWMTDFDPSLPVEVPPQWRMRSFRLAGEWRWPWSTVSSNLTSLLPPVDCGGDIT